MNNMTVFSSKDGKWWEMYGQCKTLNYSALLEHLKFDRKLIKKMKLKLRKGKGDNLRYESVTFKYNKTFFKVVNSGTEIYDNC